MANVQGIAQNKALDAETRHQRLVAQALRSLELRARKPGIVLNSPRVLGDWFRLKLAEYDHEVFAAAWLDNNLRLIAFEEMFKGTIDWTFVPIREVLRAALDANASAVAFAHNHPSNWAVPSKDDVGLTAQLRQALNHIGVRLVDHFLVTRSTSPVSIK